MLMKYDIIKIVIVLTILAILIPSLTMAQGLVPCGRFDDVVKKDAAGQPLKDETGNIVLEEEKFCKLNDLIGLLISIINIALELSGLVVVVMLILNGLKMASAGVTGKAELYESGKKGATLAILGFILILSAFVIINIIWGTVLSSDYDFGTTWYKPWQ